MSIVVTGSVAFDHIMDFPGYFKDHILPDKVHILNVSFLVDTLKKLRGGCAANIAYNLALLGERPRVVATVGEDFEEYRRWLEAHGVDTTMVRVVPGEFTASAFIITDRADNQIAGFYAGAMRLAHSLSLHDIRDRIEMAIIAPNDPAAMVRYVQECQELRIPYIYDPGQQIVSLTGEQLAAGIRGARCVIGNDYEMALITQKTGYPLEGLLDLAESVIVTFGERGSRILDASGCYEIPAVPAREVVDPTGAGDAYRAGVLLGLVRGESPARYGRIASLAATYAVETYGTQEHTYTLAEFAARFQAAFGETLEGIDRERA